MYITGKLIDIDEERLALDLGYTAAGWWISADEPVIYPHTGLDVKASWVKRFLGTKVRCRLDGTIRSISQAR